MRQAGGKIVTAWAVEGDCDPGKLISNTCQIEWPPRSGRLLEFPEVDCGRWFSLHEAREPILKSQEPFLFIAALFTSACLHHCGSSKKSSVVIFLSMATYTGDGDEGC
ncbi:hypothetical protein [Edaphobacter aggregans]|uniref:hypothetical protein n=1 Tax=Edaphobacter aggregans TaxID=570835 RepID=UPI0021AD8DD0|nr:hypothetical protein [Edaphobacter aggregans]